MRVLIVGGGRLGANVARSLLAEGHDIVIIERNVTLCEELGSKLDALFIVGVGASPPILERAGVREADVVVAVTDSDEKNMIVCLLAKNFGVKRCIARIRHPEYYDPSSLLTRNQLPIDRVVNPEQLAVQAMERLIYTKGALEAAELADGRILVVEFLVPPDSPMHGCSMVRLQQMVPGKFLLAAIHRGDEVIIPSGNVVVEKGDRIYVIIPRESLQPFVQKLHREVQPITNVAIHGATSMGIGLAKRLAAHGTRVTLIDEDPERCVQAGMELDRVTILRGSCMNLDVLDELRLQHYQVFCSLLDDDAANLMSALLAKERGVGKTIIHMSEPDFAPVAERHGIDSAINPSVLAQGTIVWMVRAGQIVSLIPLYDLRAEVQELVAAAGSRIVEKPLASLTELIPADARIGAIVRPTGIEIAGGASVIAPGDRVIVFATTAALPHLRDLFHVPGTVAS